MNLSVPSDRAFILRGARRLASAQQRFHRLRRRWYRLRFYLEAAGSLQELACGRDLCLDVPVSVGGGRGKLEIGNCVVLGYLQAPRIGDGAILLEPRSPDAVISIGSGTTSSNNISIIAMGAIRIGERARLGDLVQVFDCDFHEVDPERRDRGTGPVEPVIIGNNVWVGSRVMILRGVTIGDNSVIGAGSVVTRSIPPNSVAAGVPAKVIRNL